MEPEITAPKKIAVKTNRVLALIISLNVFLIPYTSLFTIPCSLILFSAERGVRLTF